MSKDVVDRALTLLTDELRSIVKDFNQAIAPVLAVSRFRSLSNVDIEALRSLNARIQSHSGEWGAYRESKKTESGANTFPWVEQNELVQEFVQFMYDKDLVVNFDWPHWREGRDWYTLNDESKYKKLDIEMALKLLTTVIRNDRFNEGALVRAFEDGSFPKIINKLTVF